MKQNHTASPLVERDLRQAAEALQSESSNVLSAFISAASIALEVLQKHKQLKGDAPMGMLGHRAIEAIDSAFNVLERDPGPLLEEAADMLEADAQRPEDPYDQQALELCETCGWKTLIPGDGCLNCLRAVTQEPVAWAVQACSRMWVGEFAEHDAKAEAIRCGGTCYAYPIYREPQPIKAKLSDIELNVMWREARKYANPTIGDAHFRYGRAIEKKVRGEV